MQRHHVEPEGADADADPLAPLPGRTMMEDPTGGFRGDLISRSTRR